MWELSIERNYVNTFTMIIVTKMLYRFIFDNYFAATIETGDSVFREHFTTL
ncbi:hypothetical protein Q427_31655 [Halomonas sp. BC04]|nr:hypothetical protein Q427_31655 [Halomonas sp. BC04]